MTQPKSFLHDVFQIKQFLPIDCQNNPHPCRHIHAVLCQMKLSRVNIFPLRQESEGCESRTRQERVFINKCFYWLNNITWLLSFSRAYSSTELLWLPSGIIVLSQAGLCDRSLSVRINVSTVPKCLCYNCY